MPEIVKGSYQEYASSNMLSMLDQLTFAKFLSLTRSGMTKTLSSSVAVLEQANQLFTGPICSL